MKNKINRFNKTFAIKLAEGNYDEEAIEEGKYFDPSFLEVDRILTATEMFPVIHQKKVKIFVIFRPMKLKANGPKAS